MRYEKTSPPSTYPVTTTEARTHCLIYGSADDTYLDSLIAAATRHVESLSSRQLLTATWAARMDDFPEEIELRILPVASVVSIVYVDPDAVSQTLAAANYRTDIESPDCPGRISPAYGMTWPAVRGETYNAVTVSFTAGYGAAAAVPETYKQAILLLVAHWFENREPVNIGNIVNTIPLAFTSLMAAEGWGTYA